MNQYVRVWHKAPFIRLLLALAAGILIQWQTPLHVYVPLVVFILSGVFTLVYTSSSLSFRYRKSVLHGVFFHLLFVSAGSLILWLNDIRNDPFWIGHQYRSGDALIVSVNEPPVEKQNSFKAEAVVQSIIRSGSKINTQGKIILYFKKDTSVQRLQYGSLLLIDKPLQHIKNSGNPGAFNYRQYAFMEGYTHQVYLTANDYRKMRGAARSAFRTFIYSSRQWIVQHLKTYIGIKEQGFAEAILIGYKNDLDKDLVQAYSNTGVVHIIAISGLHLGLIFAMIKWLTRSLKRRKLIWIRLLIIITSVWLFSILAGAQPSILRAAVMFSFVAIGEASGKRSAVYNTLALSAFILLCYNPYFLWDVGFQLSYAAVLSIVTFFKPIYHWAAPENKIVDFFWKVSAVTLSAQILTMPISMYHFHQAPLLFVFSNIVAVPLASVILTGLILLCAAFSMHFIAAFVGGMVTALIAFLNNYILAINRLSFVVWNQIYLSTLQTVLLLLCIVSFCFWLLEKNKNYLRAACISITVFLLIRAGSFWQAYHQQQLLVYNVPKHLAIDVIQGRNYHFIGSDVLLKDGYERNFHLQPSRTMHRIRQQNTLPASTHRFHFAGKEILIIDSLNPHVADQLQSPVDLLILSGNPRLYIKHLPAEQVKQIVIAGSVPPWKAAYWQRDADSLKIPCHNVSEKGAFVMSMH